MTRRLDGSASCQKDDGPSGVQNKPLVGKKLVYLPRQLL